jgi:DNA primase
MERLLGNAASLVDMLWQHERDAAPLNTPEDKAGLKARLLAHIDTIGNQDIRSLYRRDLLDRFSAFAFPKREPFRPGRRGVPLPSTSSPETLGRLRRASSGGARDAFSAAVLAGLIRWPREIARHAELLARSPGLDPRFDILLDCIDAVRDVESADLSTILSQYGLDVPEPAAYSGLRFGFLANEVGEEQAADELEQAIGLLVERPALEAALGEATAQFEAELSEEAYEEQQRLLKRKLEFDSRLRQMAAKRASVSQGNA